MTFKKICKICNSEFESEYNNTLYCSDKCKKRAYKKAYRRRKMKHINAVKRGDESEIKALITQAYKLAHDAAKLLLPKYCSYCNFDKNHICNGSLVIHHIDHNILNNSPNNLMWLCEKAHHEIHNNEEDCSIINELKAYITIKKQLLIHKKNKGK